jgi:hypothetical protein
MRGRAPSWFAWWRPSGEARWIELAAASLLVCERASVPGCGRRTQLVDSPGGRSSSTLRARVRAPCQLGRGASGCESTFRAAELAVARVGNGGGSLDGPGGVAASRRVGSTGQGVAGN